jgi:hypothetical protein
MQYRIINVSAMWSLKKALEKLTAEVNDAMAQGWEPLGGVCVTAHDGELLQAMVKRR